MRRMILAISIATLAGCATPSQKVDQLLEGLLSQPLTPDSVYRDGDTLSFGVVGDTTLDKVPRSAQFEATCSAQSVNIMYLDGMRRLYLGGNGRSYYEPHRLQANVAAALYRNPSFTQACAQTAKPDWRIVKADAHQNWVMIDRNSLADDGREVKFWGAYDQPEILTDMPYNAPYAQKRERYAVNCSSKQWRMLAGYDVNASNQVTDGRIEAAPLAKPFNEASADYAMLINQVCEGRGALAQLPAYTPRPKVSAPMALRPVSPQVLDSIARSGLPAPAKTLSYLRMGGTSTSRGSTTPLVEELFITRDATTGQLATTLRGKGYEGNRISWRGLVSLSEATRYGTSMSETSSVTQLSLEGDWRNMPVGSQLTYTRQGSTLNSIVGSYGDKPMVTDCKVTGERAANELNPALSGGAKTLDCMSREDKYKQLGHYVYLQDYGFFLTTGSDKNSFFYSERHIEQVQ
ncbi:MAG: hypothetical protein PW845_01000 [Pseudomonas sp.]|nr:hypothetical protein [Pseudomonas sp.]